MEHADGGFQALVTQVLIEGRQIHRHHQPLVGDDVAGQRADVEVRLVDQRLLGQAAGHEQRDVKGFLGVTGLDEQLTDTRQALQRHRATHAGVHRHLAPAEHLDTTLCQARLEHLAGAFLTLVVVGQEDHAHGIAVAQFDTQAFLGGVAHEAVGHLQQQAAAVTGLAVGSNTATVGHAGQGFDGSTEQFMASLPFHVGDQAKPAVVTELAGLVKTSVHGRASGERVVVTA